MAAWQKYRPWLRKPGRRTGAPGGRLLPALLGVGLALLAIHGVEAGLGPAARTLALAQLRSTVTAMIQATVDQTLAGEGVAYSDLVTLRTDDTGAITAMTASAPRMNALRAQILDDLIPQAAALDSGTLGVPLGDLTGLTLLSGRGPRVPVRVLSVVSADAQFRSVFTEAGINQTRHQILLDVQVSLTVLIAGETVEAAVSSSIPAAETVLVGQVPQVYLQGGK